MVRFFQKILFAIFLLASTLAYCGSFELRFSVAIVNEANDIFPDSFAVFGKPETVSNSLIASPLFQPPAPPSGKYVKVVQSGVPSEYTRESMAYDPNEPDLLYSMSLSAFDEQAIGLSGNCVIQLENPEALSNLPQDCLVYIRHLDNLGTFIASYDLSDPSNHSFQWPISEVIGLFGRLDFLVVDKCTAADLKIDEIINLEDYAVLASNWNQTGIVEVDDIFLDETVDLKDLSVLVEKWLCSCTE